MKQKAKCVRDTIRQIEASTETPKLIRLNITPKTSLLERGSTEAISKETNKLVVHTLVRNSEKRLLKIFILAGQSNMEGHAEIRTFDYIGKDPATLE